MKAVKLSALRVGDIIRIDGRMAIVDKVLPRIAGRYGVVLEYEEGLIETLRWADLPVEPEYLYLGRGEVIRRVWIEITEEV